eukprot:3658324-Pyramimonas_sp.AAC.1
MFIQSRPVPGLPHVAGVNEDGGTQRPAHRRFAGEATRCGARCSSRRRRRCIADVAGASLVFLENERYTAIIMGDGRGYGCELSDGCPRLNEVGSPRP